MINGNEIKAIYNVLSAQFSNTLKKTSEDTNKTTADKYMTLCEKPVVNLVYNEKVKHGQVQLEDTGINKIQDTIFKLAHIRKIRFGLHRFKKLYFKDVFTYSKSEFELEFVAKY